MNKTFYKVISTQKKISPHILKFEFNLGIFIVSIWVIETNEGYFLIDTGMLGMANYVLSQLSDKNILGIFLTHGHSDHIGGLKALELDLPIGISKLEFPYISGQVPYPKRRKPEKNHYDMAKFLDLGSAEIQDLLKQADLLPIFTPGHSPGHHCFYHQEDKVIIAGDLFTTNKANVLKPPMKQYTADMDQALRSGYHILKQYPHALLSVCHGGEVRDAIKAFENSSWAEFWVK